MNGSAQVVHGDARNLKFLADESVDLIVTSPPYFALRSYRDGDEHYDGQIGSEATPDDFIDALTACMDEWRRVLKPSGSVWVNLGDKYAGTGGANGNTGLGMVDDGDDVVDQRSSARNNTKFTRGYRPKTLLGLPWRFAIRQIDAGWILRAEVIWSKPNGLPESVTDRVRRSHEQWFHFTKEPRYFAAVDEVREAYRTPTTEDGRFLDLYGRPSDERREGIANRWHEAPDTKHGHGGWISDPLAVRRANPLGRLPGSVWEIPTEPLIIPDAVREARNLPDHFAAFPKEWPRRIIQAWSPDGGVVLDPFGGTGTVAGVARALGRHGISVDLSRDYCRLAEWRIFESGHFDKTLKRSMADKQGTLL